MRPIPVGATAAMLFSMAVSFVVTPWAAYRMLRWHTRHGEQPTRKEDWTIRAYRRVMGPMIRRPLLGATFLLGITALLAAAIGLVVVGAVKVKMLPYDNKSELQVIIAWTGRPWSTPRTWPDIAAMLRDEPEVLNCDLRRHRRAVQLQRLVRHYFLRRGANVADISSTDPQGRARRAEPRDLKRIREDRLYNAMAPA
jgi:hypothetical protein